MEEPRWHNNAEAYRAVQALARDGRYQEAIEQAQRVLLEGGLGRKHAARLHSQICWMYIEQLHKVCPAAVLHAEEAVRLAELARDQWIRTEAYSRLTLAHCRLGDPDRARSACHEVARELELNELALSTGPVGLLQLEALVAEVAGDQEGCLTSLVLAEELAQGAAAEVLAGIHLQRAFALLHFGCFSEAARLLQETDPAPGAGPSMLLEWEVARAWLETVTRAGPETGERLAGLTAQAAAHPVMQIHCLALRALLAGHTEKGEATRLALLALERCRATGRTDLSVKVRRLLGQLLP